ncbi:poly(A) polymerase [Streptomyces subrutilus]|uniref:Polynucleotide adenylyltransferase n=1 Tax=Streptomyces subrutilus TaxID=36818 RepID=A0A1E5PM93_9ACTN|nr:poly(A) polymerase [Streptomyces subrutilus]OEJ30686.1 polynucleotide adenylyltransferase [Streptomyces subrutilus]
MRTSEELYHQVRWDPRFDPARFVLGLLQRGAAPKRVPLPSFVPGGDIPWHRVLFVEADGELVWDRATGLDRIDATEAGRVRDPRLLRAPFFTARTPHAWDPSGGGAWRPAPAPAPRGSASGSPATVRLLTWNTLWDRYDGPRIATARRRPLLLADLAAADADVIALQEAEPELLRMLLAADWVRAGYTLGTDPGGRDVAECGLLVLSRLPVREAGLHALGPHKAVTAVTVDTAAGPLVVAATHLTSDHTENGELRRRAELARLAQGLGGVEAPVALLGDFNDGGSGAAGPAAALGMRDAWSDVHGEADGTPTFDPVANPLAAVGSLSGRAARLDRILLKAAGPARVTRAALRGDVPGPDGLFVSDHYGVEATVEFGGGAGVARLEARATARTAVAWLPPDLPEAVHALRREHDPQAGRWPAHVNLLFGFVPESSFEEALPLLAEVAAGTPAFTARLAGVHSFGHREDATVWLDPAADGEAPWQELRRELVRRFPGCQGRAEGYTPHLTLGRSRDPQRAVAESTARLGAGVSARVGELAVLSRRGDGPMRARAVVELGTGRVRWLPEPALPARDTPDAAAAHGVGPHGADPHGADPHGADRHDVDPHGVDRHDVDPQGVGPSAPAAALTARIADALVGGAVWEAGSRRMGCALPDADLDLVAAVPGAPDIAEVRERVVAALPEAVRTREVTGARVPGLRLSAAGLDVDLVVVPTGTLEPARAVARRAELGERAAVALSAVSDADAVREFAGAEHAAFARLAREVKAWARARGLDSAPFGGLPGLAWAVLAARTVRAAADRSPAALLLEFFGTWAAWDWRDPVGLDTAPPGTPVSLPHPDPVPGAPDPVPPAPDPVTVLTPSAPVRSCTAQVGPGLRDLLGRELYRAWELLDADPGAFEAVVAAPPLHRRHAAWAVVTVRASTEREFDAAVGRMRGRMRGLLGALEESGTVDAHAWPHPFTRGPGLARYAVGLGAAAPDAARLAAVAGPWSRGLAGVEVAWAACGEVPDLNRTVDE